MEKASSIAPNNAEILYNMGGAYYTIQNFPKALEYWGKTLQIKPDHKQALEGYNAMKNIQNQVSVKTN